MNTTPANLMVAALDHVVCIQVNGKANFTSSVDLKKLINELWERGCNRFIFDLTNCVMMDSTFLGVLSGIGLKFAADRGASESHTLELLNPNSRIAEVLENLGVIHLFQIQTGGVPVADRYEPVGAEDANKAEVTRTCLEAHQTLMNINPQNVRKFKDVAQFLAEDLKRIESGENNS